MTDSRSRILNSIRKSLAGARHLPDPPGVSLAPPGVSPGPQALAQQFAEELAKLTGIFMAVPLPEVPACIARLARERSLNEMLAWDPAHLPVPGVIDQLQREGISRIDPALPADEPARSQRLLALEQVRLGLTGADAALADTGTLALRSGPGRPRLASLSVRTHIALITPHQLHASWAAWWAAIDPQARAAWVSDSSNLTLITGPSRTADIEMTLTVGVHGPGEVIVILCEAAG